MSEDGEEDAAHGGAAWWAAKAVTWGYRKVYLFDGGAKTWKDAGYPVETGQEKDRKLTQTLPPAISALGQKRTSGAIAI